MAEQTTQAPPQAAMNLDEQREAFEFQKKASYTDLHIRRCGIIINSLAIGGDTVNPLFTKKQRTELETKLHNLLTKI